MDLENFDLSKRADEGQWITLRNPITGEESDARIKVLGKDSKRFRQLVFDRLDRRARKNSATNAEEAAADTLWVIAQCTVAWEGITEGGRELKIDERREVVRQVYQKYFWIYEQVQEGMAMRAAEGEDVEGKSLPGQAGASSSATAETAHRTGTKAARSSASAATEA